jgi:hypothetical protein
VGAARTDARDADAGIAIEAEVMTMTTSSSPGSPEATAIPPARCWTCGEVMTNLALHPRGGPWVCLVCKHETVEAARARHNPSSAAPVVATVEQTAASAEAQPVEDAQAEDCADEDVDVEAADDGPEGQVPFWDGKTRRAREDPMAIQHGRYVVNDDLIDAALEICGMFDSDARAHAEGRQTRSADEWANAMDADPDINAAFRLLGDGAGRLDPDGQVGPGALMRAWQRGDREVIRTILEEQAGKVFPRVCPECKKIVGSPHRH